MRTTTQFFLFAILTSSAFSQDSEELNSSKLQYTPLPMIGSAPETGLQYGANLTAKFNLGKSKIINPSFISLTFLNTAKSQFLAISKQEIYTNNWKFVGLIDYKKFPENFYGIGSKSKIQDSTMISWTKFESELRAMKRLNKESFFGAQIIISSLDTVKILGNKNEYSNVSGFKGGSFSGVGASFNYDTRDDPFTAKNGTFIDAKINFLNGDYKHSYFEIDGRKFFSQNNKVLALQTKIYSTSGRVPFWALPKLLNQTGNSFIFRGLPDGRYRDNNAIASQIEYRHSFQNRLGFVLFGSAGTVFQSWPVASDSQVKIAYGVGLRYQLRKDSAENLRLDIGFSPNEPVGLYILFKEAF